LADCGINDRQVKTHPLNFDENLSAVVYTITVSVEYANVEYLNHKIIKSRGALCRFDDTLVRILILGTNNYSVM